MKADAPASSAPSEHTEALVRFFHGLDDPTRVAILELLLEGEKSVGELVERLGRFQGRVSSHLACLRWCGYVRTRREGRNVYYALADQRIRDLLVLAHDLAGEHAAALSTCSVLGSEAGGTQVPAGP